MPYKTPPQYGDTLGLRERQVLEGIARGLTNPTIAAELGLALDTVKYYARTASRKLGANTRAQAVLVAYRTGVLRQDCPTCGRPVERAGEPL
ncbi:MAG: hypothetical protein JWO98_101 [Frankiales bacterium]|nr:hypothetical protein [Frankiales bacterium]